MLTTSRTETMALSVYICVLTLSLVHQIDGGRKGVTLMDCIKTEIPATVSQKFQECSENVTVGTFSKFMSGLQCILWNTNAIKPDRLVDVKLLFSAVGDFKGTQFEYAVNSCAEPPLLAIRFTGCVFEKFQEVCKDRVRKPVP